MNAAPIKWEPWITEYTAGHLPIHIRRGRARADNRSVEVYMSRGDESRWCRAWHVGIRIDGRLVFQSGMHTAETKRDAAQDLVYKAYRWFLNTRREP